ncbi:TlyA family RNA methyltransferase [Microbacterium sp. NPDC076911]|uniref:TlyA family RNA methyltransferase n=1 Tax=Microbacterium sp. NPDC076911 TaxID=3154958 RepID=UPI0034275B37
MTVRLDTALSARGLARSRTQAASLIADGLVSVNGRIIVKASAAVDDDATIDVARNDHYVSRAAHKLIAGLDAFRIDATGRLALDMGASTGGFTQVLRERGASQVIAVDVGHGQLAPSIAADASVVSVEGYNVRYMTRENLAAASGIGESPSLITADLSFISLGLVLSAIVAVAAPAADVVLLVKPQFEVGRTAVKGGLVTNPTLRADAVARVLWSAWDAGLGTAGIVASPIAGTHGNSEYVAHFAPGGGSNPTEWLATVNQLTGSA